MSNTMGESTRRRASAAVQGGGGLGGTRSGVPANYVGGYGGGLGGTFGKSSRGLGFDQGGGYGAGAAAGSPQPVAGGGGGGGGAARPASAGRVRPSSANPGSRDPIPRYYEAPDRVEYRPSGEAVGRREKTRPASATATSVWDKPKELPRAPAPGTTTSRVRPKSATNGPKPWGREGVEPMEYKLQGKGLETMRQTGRASAGATGVGVGGGSSGGGGYAGSGAGGPAGSSISFTPPRPAVGNKHFNLPGNSVLALQQLRAAESGDSPSELQVDQISEAHLLLLEDAIRDEVRMKRSIHETSKDMLMKMFKSVDDGSGDVDLKEFIAVCNLLGVQISMAEAQALFRRFGYESVLPYERFAQTLLTQPSRQMAEDYPERKGAFQAGERANFNGKIKYRHCKKPVYTPADWDPRLADRSAELPNARLMLDFVYGYQGKDNCAQNLFYTAEQKVLYFTAGVGVVYSRPPAHSQYFFLNHTDDITAIALCPAALDFEGRQYPAKVIAATGQVTSTEEGAFICVWDTRTGSQPEGPAAARELVRLPFDKDARGFCALAFSPTGTRLVAVAQDNYHSVYVYDWRKKRELFSGRGTMGDPPQVYGIEWNPYEVSHGAKSGFVQFGKKHIKLWTADEKGSSWSSKALSFGRLPMQSVTSVQWLPPRSNAGSECLIVGGMGDGQLYVFKGGVAIKAIAAHRSGPKEIQPDGHPAYAGLRGLRVIKDGQVLLSGGADGTILQWDTSDGSIEESRFAGSAIQLSSPFGPGSPLPAIRALDYDDTLRRILVGTNNCDVLEVTETSADVLMDGHSGDVWFVAFHPAKPNVFATVSDSGHVHMWDASTRSMTHCAALGWTPRTVAFSTNLLPPNNTHHMAVGGLKGHIKILDEGQNLRPLHECRDSREGILDIKYCPNNRFMAAATSDAYIDIYSLQKGYQRIARCTGHSSSVRGIDWSIDSSIIMSNSNDYELLFWDRAGKQITLPQRNLDTHTYTNMLGFPVMGIWPPDSDGTDINSLDRSKNRQWVVTSDDDGKVKLFNYPCVIEDAPHRAYRGHSSHVLSVRFNCDDSLVCSGGGHDWAVFQFRVVELKPQEAPPPAPEPVWGPLDNSGRNYGFTTTPHVVTAGRTSSGAGLAAGDMPAIREEDEAPMAPPERTSRTSERPPLPPAAARPSSARRTPPPESQPEPDEDLAVGNELGDVDEEEVYTGYDEPDDVEENEAPLRMHQ